MAGQSDNQPVDNNKGKAPASNDESTVAKDTAAPAPNVASAQDFQQLLQQLAVSQGGPKPEGKKQEDYKFWNEEGTQQDPKEWRRFGKRIRDLTGGEDIDIVFEHPGRETFGASVFVTRKGGVITTCASTSGYMHEYDNRYLWMNLKRIVSSHFANYREAWEANELVARGLIHPTLSRTYSMTETGQAALDVHRNAHQGKVGVLCLAPEEGLACVMWRSGPSTSTGSICSAAPK